MLKVDEKLRARILKLREGGMGKQEIADKCGLARSTIRRVLDPDYANHMRELARGRRGRKE